MPTPEGFRFNPRVEATPLSPIREFLKGVPKGIPTYDLGLGQLPYQLPEAMKEAVIQATKRDGTNMYTPNNGLPELRQLVAHDVNKRDGTQRNESEVMVTAGSTEAIKVALETFNDKGNRVLLPQIYYPGYTGSAGILGMRSDFYSLKEDFEPDTSDILEQLDQVSDEGTQLVMLNSPANPTGHVTKEETLRKLAEETKGRNVIYISDDIYERFTYDGRTVKTMAEFLPDQTISISGFSKSASATGLRIGWMTGPSEIIDQASKVHQYTVSSAASLMQHAAIPLLKGECEEEIAFFVSDLERKRKLVYEGLHDVPGLGVTKPEGAFYFFIEVNVFGGSSLVSSRLRDKGILTTPGTAFGKAGWPYIRVSYAADDTILSQAIEKMKGMFEKWH